MANLLNEAEIKNTWAPIISEATGINESEKLAWMSTYCHNHKLYEDANIMSVGNVGPMNLAGMGAVSFPSAISNGSGVNGNGQGGNGSGDKSPTLLPLAMQVAAQTIGLDLVPVIPMAGPMGLLSYLDFVYEGGRLDGGTAPTYIKSKSADGAGTANGYTFTKLDQTSRIDGHTIYKVTGNGDTTKTMLEAFESLTAVDNGIALVAALEDHIIGFTGGGVDGAKEAYEPMSRNVGESTPDKVMGLSLFSKSVAAETFQVAAAVTREQVQDLKQFGVDAVAQVEAVLTNELTQSINKHILGKMRAIAERGITNFALDYNLGGNTYGDVNRRILTHILAAANLIANRGRRGAGNFAVVDAKVASALQAVAGFVPNPMANTFNQVAGAIYPLGSIAGINVYTDPNMAFEGVTIPAGEAEATKVGHEILVGRKGDGNGAGLVFMPYLMAESVQTIAEGTMAPKVAVKSRYALVEAGFHPETQYQRFFVAGVAL